MGTGDLHVNTSKNSNTPISHLQYLEATPLPFAKR